MNDFALRGAVSLAHQILEQQIQPGDRVIDATCGNGRDTLLAARLVGETGHVWGFDIQPQALAASRALLMQEGLLPRVTLIETGHERMAEFVTAPVQAVIFNLGYLPGGDRSLATRSASSLEALQQASGLIVAGGIISVAIYPGHMGGEDEATAVQHWASSLSSREFSVWSCRQINRVPSSPYLVLVGKQPAPGKKGTL